MGHDPDSGVDPQRLLSESREARWSFPSSSGTPVRKGDADAGWPGDAPGPDDVVAAARTLIERGEREAAVELAANSWRLWMLSRDIAGGRAFLAEVLEDGDEPSRARALASYGDSLFAFWQGAQDDARRRSEAALEDAEAVDDPEALALAHLALSRVAFSGGQYDRSLTHAIEARRYAREVSPELGQAPLHAHAQAARLLGDYEEAARLFEESLALNREVGDQGMVGVELHNLGHVQIHRGDVDAAERCFAQAAEAFGPSEDPYGIALEHLNKAVVALGRGDRAEAGRRLDAIDATLEEGGSELFGDDRFELDWLRGELARQT